MAPLANVPAPLLVNVTVPVGVVGDELKSVTVAVQRVVPPTATVEGSHSIVVLVALALPAWTVVVPLLPPCALSPPYVAVIVCGPAVLAVYIDEQLALATPPLTVPAPRVQLDGLNEPVLLEKLTVPVGTVAVPGVLSLTVAVQFVVPPTATLAGTQLTAVDVLSSSVRVTSFAS